MVWFFHVAFLHEDGLDLLHGVLVPFRHLLVVHDGGGVVNTYHAASLLLYLERSVPWLIHILCWHLRKLGHVPPERSRPLVSIQSLGLFPYLM